MILDKVRSTIRKYSLFSPGDRVLVAVSGGPDSISLLHILKSLQTELRVFLTAAHIDHGLRGEESAQDAVFVADVAQKLGIPYVGKKLDMKGRDMMKGVSLQAAARKLRYRFFFGQKAALPTDKIALAHTADDQAETVLMRFLTGTGVTGLAGIPAVRPDGVVRPLIELCKEEILQYLHEQRISFRVDRSNRKKIYLRNRLRLELIPHLQNNYQPNLTGRLNSLAEILRDEDSYLKKRLEKVWEEIGICHNPLEEELIIPLDEFNKLHIALKRRIIRKAIHIIKGNLINIERLHLEKALSLCGSRSGEKRISLPAGVLIIKSYGNLIIGRAGRVNTDPGAEFGLCIPGQVEIRELNLKITASWVTRSGVQYGNPLTVYFDADKTGTAPLIVRCRKTGDRFVPLGLKKSKLLSRCLIDWKVPQRKRDKIPLVVCTKGILWVTGHRNCDWAKITEKTDKILQIKSEKF